MTPGAATSPELAHAFTLQIRLGEVIDVGETARGRRRIVPITGGTVTGPRLTATVLPVGADYQFIRADGTTELEARYVLETSSGDRVYLENRGYRTASPEDVERLTRSEPVDAARVYFRTTPRFEAAAADLQWLTRTVFVAVGERFPESVSIAVFEVG